MKKYSRSHIANYILKMRGADLSKMSDDYLADQIMLLRRMKAFMDAQTQEIKASLRFIKGGKDV